MKKVVVITFAAAAFALLLAGCASAPAGEGGATATPAVNVADQSWFVTREEGGMAARNNQINLLRGDTFIYIYFRGGMPGAYFDTIKIDFTAAAEVGVTWQAVYDSGVWGSEEFIGVMSEGPIETDCTSFNINWWGTNPSFIKDEMRGLCLKINSPDGRALFTVTDVSFIGLQN